MHGHPPTSPIEFYLLQMKWVDGSGIQCTKHINNIGHATKICCVYNVIFLSFEIKVIDYLLFIIMNLYFRKFPLDSLLLVLIGYFWMLIYNREMKTSLFGHRFVMGIKAGW